MEYVQYLTITVFTEESGEFLNHAIEKDNKSQNGSYSNVITMASSYQNEMALKLIFSKLSLLNLMYWLKYFIKIGDNFTINIILGFNINIYSSTISCVYNANKFIETPIFEHIIVKYINNTKTDLSRINKIRQCFILTLKHGNISYMEILAKYYLSEIHTFDFIKNWSFMNILLFKFQYYKDVDILIYYLVLLKLLPEDISNILIMYMKKVNL